MANLEFGIRLLTRPVDGKYPRPWMTTSSQPGHARVFVVGNRQAKTFSVDAVGEHDRLLDALFNRNGASCRALYDSVTGGKPSPTRKNLDDLRGILEAERVTDLIETNVVCFSAPTNSMPGTNELRLGEELFRFLLGEIGPRAMIVHGAGPLARLAKLLEVNLPAAPQLYGEVVSTRVEHRLFSGRIFPVRSLGPPEWSRWSSWAPRYLQRVAQALSEELSGP